MYYLVYLRFFDSISRNITYEIFRVTIHQIEHPNNNSTNEISNVTALCLKCHHGKCFEELKHMLLKKISADA